LIPLPANVVARKFPKHFFGNSIAFFGAQLFASGALAAQASDIAWAAHNRILTVNFGYLNQDYTEHDPYGLTADGTLDTERGNINSAGFGARWQAETIPLQLQATARRSNGGTHYNGYLQSGNSLTPYSATTGNIMLDIAARAGFPIAQSENWQWIPFIELQHHRWQRELTQYTENFKHTAGLAGLQVQWRQRADADAAIGMWSFELEGAAGKMLDADMRADSLGFNQPLGKRSLWQLGATASYDIAPQWRISADAHTQRLGYGQSAIQNGMSEPSSTTRQTTIGIGLGWRY